MAGLDSVRTQLKKIHNQAQMLTSAFISLDKSFEAESDRLARQEAVHRIKMIRTTITGDLERIRDSESTANSAQVKTDEVVSFFGDTIKLIATTTTKNRRTRNFVNSVFNTNPSDNLPYGKVKVCIGSKGLPDDVRVVSISELARESNRLESDIIASLKNQGFLLLSEKNFSSLIEKLVEMIQEEGLVLPVPTEKVAELTTPNRPEWQAVKTSQTQFNLP